MLEITPMLSNTDTNLITNTEDIALGTNSKTHDLFRYIKRYKSIISLVYLGDISLMCRLKKTATYKLCLEGGNIPFYFAGIKTYALLNVNIFVLEYLKVIRNIIFCKNLMKYI
jgi:hypothetical protein